MNRLKCVDYVVVFLVLILIALSGCAGQVNPDRVVLNSDGTMIDTGRNLMWQQGRSRFLMLFSQCVNAVGKCSVLFLLGTGQWPPLLG